MMEERSSGKVFNVCGTTKHKMQYFTDKLIEAAGFSLDEVEQKINPDFYRPIDIQVQVGDSSDVTDLVDWAPTIPIETTLSDLLAYWERKLAR